MRLVIRRGANVSILQIFLKNRRSSPNGTPIYCILMPIHTDLRTKTNVNRTNNRRKRESNLLGLCITSSGLSKYKVSLDLKP